MKIVSTSLREVAKGALKGPELDISRGNGGPPAIATTSARNESSTEFMRRGLRPLCNPVEADRTAASSGHLLLACLPLSVPGRRGGETWTFVLSFLLEQYSTVRDSNYGVVNE